MRNPNGYGCIKKLSGRRRRPFVFVVSDHGRQKPIEYFTSLVDAQIYQADYNRAHGHRSLPGHKITFAELYHRWLPRHIDDAQPSQSAVDSYRNAYQHLSTLHGMSIEDLRYADYQRVIDDMRRHGLSYSSVKKVRSLISPFAQIRGQNRAVYNKLCAAAFHRPQSAGPATSHIQSAKNQPALGFRWLSWRRYRPYSALYGDALWRDATAAKS